jgi:hypothetical protein
MGKEPAGKHAVIADGAAALREPDGAEADSSGPAPAGVIRIPGAAPRLVEDEDFLAETDLPGT